MTAYAFRLLPGVLLLVSTCIFLPTHIKGQTYTTLAPFMGKAYKLTKEMRKQAYGDYILQLEPFAEIKLNTLHISSTFDTIPLKGIPMNRPTGFLFESALKVKESGMYRVILSSDDGSILWVNDTIVIHNDGLNHKPAKDKIAFFEEGVHPVKLWYFQGWPDQYRLKLDIQFLESARKTAFVVPNEKLNFGFDSFTLTSKGKLHLDSLLAKIADRQVKQVNVKGHTDNLGTDDYNKTLSLNRAEAVVEYLKLKLNKQQISFKVEGHGEDEPLADNDTESGRSKNRRVEIAFYFE